MKQQPVMIGIAGGSCSGKTQLAHAIAASMPAGNAVSIGLDSYYVQQPPMHDELPNYDHPDALEKNLLIKQLRALSLGEPIRKPVYDFARHCRCSHGEVIQPERFVIVEGLYTLYWQELLRLFMLKAFIDLDHATCLERRLARDTTERGRTPESVIRQYRETVGPMYDQYILPTKKSADLVLDGSDSIADLAGKVRKLLPE